ncbi:eCIS core domain-containing protein [Geodermatophilus aquaeductus]|nr:DUF4157 domain-containing protein [Geodermatophilus aquaeductus]
MLQSPGQPLEAPVREQMGRTLGHDFSRIRVHTDAEAAESARAIDARAFTLGQHIVMGRHEYSPHTRSGGRLLAHELVHTLQQHVATPHTDSVISSPSDVADLEADRPATDALGANTAAEDFSRTSGRDGMDAGRSRRLAGDALARTPPRTAGLPIGVSSADGGGSSQAHLSRQAEDAGDSPRWTLFGETEGERGDTGASPGAVWRWLSWAGIGLADLVNGAVAWFGYEDLNYDVSADLLRHYMSGRGAPYALDMPREWAMKIASAYKRPGRYKEVKRAYAWGIPDMRNSLGTFDLEITGDGSGGKVYTVTDRYSFPYMENDKWQRGRHGFQVSFFGSLPALAQRSTNAALAALGTWQNPGGFSEKFEVKKLTGDWTLLIPQQFLADSGVDFAVHSTFRVSGEGNVEQDGEGLSHE